jgi:probable addiction module antidote protein
MKAEYAPLDISSHLDSEEMIVGYLSAAAEDEDPNVLLGALAHAAKARGMAQVAKAAGLGRESLYKALAPGSHPRFETIAAVCRALGVKVEFARGQAAAKAAPRTLTIDAFRAKLAASAKAKPRATKPHRLDAEPGAQEPGAPWEKYHAAGAGFRAPGLAHARGLAKKSSAKRPAKKSAAKRR